MNQIQLRQYGIAGLILLGLALLVVALRSSARVGLSRAYLGQENQMADVQGRMVTSDEPPASMAAESSKTVASSGEANFNGQLSDESAAPVATLAALATAQPDRYLIRNVALTVEVGDVKRTTASIVAIVSGAKGYVHDQREETDPLGRKSATLTVRIPFTRYESVLPRLEVLGKVLNKQVTSQDVTEEFVDSQAKLRNLKKTEERLLEHLSRTGKLNDIILVEREINRVRGEIEQLEGRLRYLSNQVAFSTFTITLQEKARQQPIVPPESFSTAQVASQATRELVGFARGLWSTAVWVGIWAVVWLPLVLLGALAYRRLTRRMPGTAVTA